MAKDSKKSETNGDVMLDGTITAKAKLESVNIKKGGAVVKLNFAYLKDPAFERFQDMISGKEELNVAIQPVQPKLKTK